jgi:UDP-glucose:tetrahydrobiopterin glucosyltransferase
MSGLAIAQMPGDLQISAQTQGRDVPITMPAHTVLAEIWDYARQVQGDYDLLVNFAYDWLPFYLTPFFQVPIAHLVSVGSLSDAMDRAIARVAKQFPKTVGVHSQAQANTYPFADQCRVLANGFDLSLYEFCDEPAHCLGWVGRISPEKGIEDAIAAVQQAGIPLKVWGAMPAPSYWQHVLDQYPQVPIQYQGFLSTCELQAGLRTCRGLLMTPKWVEAFGNVAIEALACGVPVIAYNRGGPGEIVESGKTGWLVEPDDIAGLVDAIARLDEIDRHACRRAAEHTYSMLAMGDRVEAWFHDILQDR